MDINLFTKTESYFTDIKCYLDSYELVMKKTTLGNLTNVVLKEEGDFQRAIAKISKERTKKFSTRLSSLEGDMQKKMDEEHLNFCYIPLEHRKDRQPLLEVCTQLVHLSRKEMRHKAF